MKFNRMHVTLLAIALGSVALVGCTRKGEVAPMQAVTSNSLPATPAPMVAAASVSAVDLGNALGPDRHVAAPMVTFAPNDTIYAAISTATRDPAASVPGKLGVKWTHVDSNQTVKQESRDVIFTSTGVTGFQISKPDGWPPGRYKVEVSQDGTVVQTREFDVR